MQFGIGLLGRGWTPEFAIEQVLANKAPARGNFTLHAACYAAKLAADTILAEPPSSPDLDDRALTIHFATSALPVRPSEVGMVRAAFVEQYGQVVTSPEQATP